MNLRDVQEEAGQVEGQEEGGVEAQEKARGIFKTKHNKRRGRGSTRETHENADVNGMS